MEKNGSGAGPRHWKFFRIWEYTGRIRRGYFVEGMSGAQFVRGEDYDAVTGALREPDDHTVWLNGTDPALVWGKVLELLKNVDFWQWPEQRWP